MLSFHILNFTVKFDIVKKNVARNLYFHPKSLYLSPTLLLRRSDFEKRSKKVFKGSDRAFQGEGRESWRCPRPLPQCGAPATPPACQQLNTKYFQIRISALRWPTHPTDSTYTSAGEIKLIFIAAELTTPNLDWTPGLPMLPCVSRHLYVLISTLVKTDLPNASHHHTCFISLLILKGNNALA